MKYVILFVLFAGFNVGVLAKCEPDLSNYQWNDVLHIGLSRERNAKKILRCISRQHPDTTIKKLSAALLMDLSSAVRKSDALLLYRPDIDLQAIQKFNLATPVLIIVTGTVTEEGDFMEIELKWPTGNTAFDQYLVNIYSRAKFKPAWQDGRYVIVRSWFRVIID